MEVEERMSEWELEPEDEEAKQFFLSLLASIWDGLSPWGKMMSKMMVDTLTEEEEK